MLLLALLALPIVLLLLAALCALAGQPRTRDYYEPNYNEVPLHARKNWH